MSHGWTAWPLLGQSLCHSPALRHGSAQLEAEAGGTASEQESEEEQRGPVPLHVEACSWENVGKHPSGPHAVWPQRDNAAAPSNSRVQKNGGEDQALAYLVSPHRPPNVRRDIGRFHGMCVLCSVRAALTAGRPVNE